MKTTLKQFGEFIVIRLVGGVAMMLVLTVMLVSFSWGFSNGIF